MYNWFISIPINIRRSLRTKIKNIVWILITSRWCRRTISDINDNLQLLRCPINGEIGIKFASVWAIVCDRECFWVSASS